MSVKTKYDGHEEKKNMHMIRKMFEGTKLDGNFQRFGGVDSGSGWSIPDSNEYITSLMGGIAYNKIIVADVECCLLHAKRAGDVMSQIYYEALWDDGDGYKYVSIDGNNTSSTITAFLGGHEKIHFIDDAGTKKNFADLTADEQDDVMYTEKLDVVTLRQIGIEEMCHLFRRLNKSTKLNAQEDRQARWSKMSQFIRETSNRDKVRTMFTNFWIANTVALDKRTHEEFVAQFALKLDKNPADGVSKPGLDAWYEEATDLSDDTKNKIKTILDAAAEIAAAVGPLTNRTGAKLKRGQMHSLFDLLYLTLHKNHFQVKDHEELFNWFVEKDDKFMEESKGIIEDEKEEKSYKYWTSTFSQKSHWTKIRAKLNEAFWNEVEDLTTANIVRKRRTHRDNFTVAQAKQAWREQNGKTREGEDISLVDVIKKNPSFEADHVVSVADGGETSADNIELTSKAANRSKGSKSNDYAFSVDMEED